MDKVTKRKLRRLWCARLIFSLFFLVQSSFLTAKLLGRLSETQATIAAVEGTSKINQLRVQMRTQAKLQVKGRSMSWVDEQKQELEKDFEEFDQSFDKSWGHAKKALYQIDLWALLFYGLAIIGSAIIYSKILISLTRLQNPSSLTFTGQLIEFLPEEYVAELGALHDRLQSQNHSTWLIRLIMLWCFLELFWAFYIQIKIENIGLPQKGDTKRIDE